MVILHERQVDASRLREALRVPALEEEAARVAEAGGLEVVMDRCVKIEYARLFGGLGWFGVNTKVISARRPV